MCALKMKLGCKDIGYLLYFLSDKNIYFSSVVQIANALKYFLFVVYKSKKNQYFKIIF